MKANDIQIGDWLYSIIDRYDHVEKKLCKVTGIRTDSDTPLIQCGDTDVWYPLDSYEPVPLTPEILEKNLATEPQIAWCVGWNKKDDIHVEIKREDLNAAFYGVIDYIHQLQHALRLCGIDKTIEL